MKTNPTRFWLLVIFLGWSFDFLFWKKPALGINFFIFVALCLIVGIYLLQIDGLRLSRRAGWILLPTLYLSSSVFFRQQPMTVFLSIAMTIFLLGVFTISYLSGNWIKFGLIDYLTGYLSLFGSMIVRPLGFMAEVKSEQPEGGEKRSSSFWAYVRGIVIALPVIAIFASLLSSADPIFADRFQKFIDLFQLDNLPEYIFRLVYILIFAYALAGTFLHAAQKSGGDYEEKDRFAPFLGFTESSIVLGAVILLFAAFVVIQFRYFFGGQANINIEGYTYSEYARKGFGELVAVAFFSLLLLLGLGAITRREMEIQRKTFSTMGVILVGLVLVMLVSAFQRLVLYETAYGFSRLRTYTHVFMIWLALLLVVVVVLEATRRERMAGLSMLIASLGFVVSLSLLNVDAFIVKQNVQREVSGNGSVSQSQSKNPELDVQYFLGLSDDAVPVLAATFENTSLPVDVRDKVGAALFCMRHDHSQNDLNYPWQSFHISRFTADSTFARLRKKLDLYKVINTDYPIKVLTSSGAEFSCSQYYYD